MSSAEQTVGPHPVRDAAQKFRVHGLFRLPDLSAVAGVTRVDDLGVAEFESVYFDTRDLRLAREGITLRRRTGTDEGWHLKLPVAPDRPESRDEFRLPATEPDVVPAAFVSMVRVILRNQPPTRVATLRTTRSSWTITAAGGMAQLADDAVHVLGPAGEIEARFRELELAEISGEPGLDAVVAALTSAGAVGGEFVAKAVRALGPRASEPPEVAPVAPPRPKDPARDTVRFTLTDQVRALRAADLAFRRDPADVEAVHQLRVATRRLRSDLRTFRSLVKGQWARSLEAELAWFGRSLTSLREADVLRQRLVEHCAELPDQLPVDAVRGVVSATLGDLVADSRAQALVVLNSERYLALHEALVEAARRPRTTSAAERPAHEALPPLMEHAWRRLAKTCAGLGHDDPDERWHVARLRAKRARYAAEAIAVVVGKDASVFAKQVERLTDVLGEHQDATQTAAMARTIATFGDVGQEVAFALGMLAGIERGRATTARERFVPAWHKARRSSLRRWFSP